MIYEQNMTSRNGILAKFDKLISYFQNRSFSKKLKNDRTKTYLYQNEAKSTSWLHFYKKARR